MNNTRKFNIKRTLLAFMLIAALIGVQVIEIVAYAAETADQQPTVVVSNYSQLYSAMIHAKDGDVIGIDDIIRILGEGGTFGKTDKHITILRMNDSAKFEFAAKPFKVQNVTFDGNGNKAWYSMVQVNTDTSFENVTFKNCHTDMNGGAMFITGGTVTITDCTFENNSGSSGGHLSIRNDSNVRIDKCTFERGYASSKGGAIEYDSSAPWCNITSSVIYNNSAGSCGGGIFNNYRMIIEQTKVYGNSASTGGADIANSIYSNMQIEHSVEQLSALYQDEEIIPKGWVNDYDFDSGVVIPGIVPELPNSLMKLDYKVKPTEVILAESSLGVAGDSRITGLESGKYYKVSTGDTTNYSNADGTLVLEELEAAPLTGTEITGLTNGETYMVEEFTPAPTSVLLDAASLGTADNEKITGLSAGKMYKVSVDGTVSYSKTDGTLTTSEEDAAALEGTEILGLTNGLTYLVEEYIKIEPTPEPEPTPSTVILESSSLGKPGDGKITDLTSGKKYKVSVDETISYVKSNGTLTSMESESGTLTGTEIVGLINGKTYKVEEYIPATTEEPKPDPTPDPEPSTPPSSNNSGGSSHSQVTKPDTNKGNKLSYGKVTLDTSKTEYLLGYSDGLMGGKDNVTKAQLVQIVYRLLTPESLTAVYSNKNSFKDVASDAWYNEAVSTLANAGLISGNGGKFNPDQDVTWGEMVSILSKFAKPNSEWKIITKHWAKDALNTVISYRWFEYNDQFNADGVVTRVEMLNFINTMFKWSKQ